MGFDSFLLLLTAVSVMAPDLLAWLAGEWQGGAQ